MTAYNNLTKFIDYSLSEWTKWFGDIETLEQVKKYFKEDLQEYIKHNPNVSEDREFKLLNEFLDFGGFRVLDWFQPDTDLPERFKRTLIYDFTNYVNEGHC